MEQQIFVLIFIYALILVTNAMASLFLFTTTREIAYRDLLFLWVFSAISIFLQGFFHHPGWLSLCALGSYIFVSFGITKFFSGLKLIKERNFFDYVISAIFAMVSLFIFLLTKEFKTAVLLMSMAVVQPLFCVAYYLVSGNRERKLDVDLFAGMLLGNAIYLLWQPWIRLSSDDFFWKYAVALFFLCLFSISLPGFITKISTYRYNQQLMDEISKTTTEIKSISDTNATLLSIVCHDLVTPLTSMDLSTDKLFGDGTSRPLEIANSIENKELQEKNRKHFRRCLSTMKAVLQEVKTLHSLRMGKHHLELKDLDVTDIVQEIVGEYKEALKGKTLSINVKSFISHQERVVGDYSMLKSQILSSVISNAIKFSRRGSSIEITLKADEKFVIVEIRDYGIGIPSDMLSSLFDIQKATTRLGTDNETGTGFGLPIAKTCMDLMMGRIEVDSREEGEARIEFPVGTMIRVYLKRVPAKVVEQRKPA